MDITGYTGPMLIALALLAVTVAVLLADNKELGKQRDEYRDRIAELVYQPLSPRSAEYITWLANMIHERNVRAGWWTNLVTGKPEDPEEAYWKKLMLCVTELAEACEGHRKGLADDKLPQYRMFDVELIDCLIRTLDLLGHRQLHGRITAGSIMADKLEFNAHRPDHKLAARMAEGGKKH